MTQDSSGGGSSSSGREGDGREGNGHIASRFHRRAGKRGMSIAAAALAAGSTLLVPPLPAMAQAPSSDAWPARPIRILLPVGVGGVTDINARLLAQRWSTTLGQTVLIDNRPGAGGIVATELVKNAIPDGHTLLWLNSGHAVATAVMKSLPYDAVKDFEPVSTIAYFAQALVVGGDSPIKSVTGLVAAARANPRKISIGMTNIGSTPHVTAELFRSMAGFEAELVPYKTSGALIAAARSGEASVIVDFIAPVLSLVQSGAVRALAVTSSQPWLKPGCPASRPRRGTGWPVRRRRPGRSSSGCTARSMPRSPCRRSLPGCANWASRCAGPPPRACAS
jgi:tripartite-type tricarboxylate transporter receptor subunit TctC